MKIGCVFQQLHKNNTVVVVIPYNLDVVFQHTKLLNIFYHCYRQQSHALEYLLPNRQYIIHKYRASVVVVRTHVNITFHLG